MIALTSTLRSLELDLSASSSSPLDIIVCFTDIRYSDQMKNAGEQLSTSNGTSDVTICAAPATGVLRLIETISVNNRKNTATATARVYYDENGTEYDIIQAALAGGDQLFYEDG